MSRISKACIHPSAAFTLKPRQARRYTMSDKPPEIGDVVLGEITRLGQHGTLENVSGRIHHIFVGSKSLFVFGNRYAPDYYEGFVPKEMPTHCDLLARSGVVGQVTTRNALIKDPTEVELLGYATNDDGEILNTRHFPLITAREGPMKAKRAKLILVVGTAMNAGKSMAASAAVLALRATGHHVNATKVTGTAGLKDVLRMNDAGAEQFNDFSHLGYPSTYLLSEEEVLGIFQTIDSRCANKSKHYWVVELADGILQRETSMLLHSEVVRSRIHRLVFAAHDAFGVVGGLKVLKERFGLVPDAISGVCSSSPLHIRELSEFTQLPVFNSAAPELQELGALLA